MFNMNIPHLKKGQKVQEWRPLYAAATATYKDAEAIKFLPIVVDRSPADQKWATAATKQATLKEALDELESRLDGRKTRFVAMKDFFNLKPTATVSLETLSTFFFQALEAGKAAEISNDVIAIKFLEFVPGATKLFNDNKAHIKTDMTCCAFPRRAHTRHERSQEVLQFVGCMFVESHTTMWTLEL